MNIIEIATDELPVPLHECNRAVARHTTEGGTSIEVVWQAPGARCIEWREQRLFYVRGDLVNFRLLYAEPAEALLIASELDSFIKASKKLIQGNT